MNEKNPTLCIVAGPNGSGKTSTTVQLLHNEWAENSLYINPDNIAQEQYGDWNSPVAVLKAAELATKMRYECLRKRQDFVFLQPDQARQNLRQLPKNQNPWIFPTELLHFAAGIVNPVP